MYVRLLPDSLERVHSKSYGIWNKFVITT